MFTTSTRLAALVAVLVLARPVIARAEDAAVAADSSVAGPELIDTDRPDLTDGSSRLDPGVVQLETGWSRTSLDPGALNSFGDALVRIGVSRAFELRVFTPGIERATFRGTSDSEWGEAGVGFKIGKTSADGDRGFALVASIVTPAESHGSSLTETQAVIAGDWGSGNVGVSANLGIHRVSGPGDGVNTELASVSVSNVITRRTSMFFEMASQFTDHFGFDWSLFGDTGASWAVANHLQLDASVGRNFDDSGAWTLGAGVSKRW